MLCGGICPLAARGRGQLYHSPSSTVQYIVYAHVVPNGQWSEHTIQYDVAAMNSNKPRLSCNYYTRIKKYTGAKLCDMLLQQEKNNEKVKCVIRSILSICHNPMHSITLVLILFFSQLQLQYVVLFLRYGIDDYFLSKCSGHRNSDTFQLCNSDTSFFISLQAAIFDTKCIPLVSKTDAKLKEN